MNGFEDDVALEGLDTMTWDAALRKGDGCHLPGFL